MRKFWLANLVVLLGGACGPSMEPTPVKTPDQIVAEQERMAGGQKSDEDGGDYADDYDADEDQKKQFDDRQAEIELKRAARSAATCGGVVEGGPVGTARVTLTFDNDGHVSESSVAPPFAETTVGKCVLRAMAAVIVPNFVGPPKTMEWEVNVKAGAKPEDKEKEE
jgi:hypothetical protein